MHLTPLCSWRCVYSCVYVCFCFVRFCLVCLCFCVVLFFHKSTHKHTQAHTSTHKHTQAHTNTHKHTKHTTARFLFVCAHVVFFLCGCDGNARSAVLFFLGCGAFSFFLDQFDLDVWHSVEKNDQKPQAFLTHSQCVNVTSWIKHKWRLLRLACRDLVLIC